MGLRTSDIYSPGSRHLEENSKLILDIIHVPTGESVQFAAFIEMLSDAFNSNWTGEDVYGRMDPIATFSNTRRAISVAWNVPADSYEHAQENITKANKLFSFLYPLYDDKNTAGATAINQGPLWRVRFGNLIRDSKTGKGLLGYVNGLTFDPTFENGMFYGSPSKLAQAKESAKNVQGLKNMSVEYLPKTFRLNFEFTVLHEHSLGWRTSEGTDGSRKKFRFRNDLDPMVNTQNFPWATTGNEKLNRELQKEAVENRSLIAAVAENIVRENVGSLTNPRLGESVVPPPPNPRLAKQLTDPGGALPSITDYSAGIAGLGDFGD